MKIKYINNLYLFFFKNLLTNVKQRAIINSIISKTFILISVRNKKIKNKI